MQRGIGMKKVSMQDIARELGLSKMTVSKCFHDSKDISEETRQAVFKKADEMGYRYTKRVKYHVAVLFSEVYFEPNEKFYHGLYGRLAEQEWNNNMKFSMIYVNREDERNLYLNPMVLENDAIMLLGQFSRKFVTSIVERRIPVVCLDFYHRGIEADSVISNSYQTSYELTSYLIEQGHHSICFLGNKNYTNSVNDRYMGYCKALMEENLAIDPHNRIDDRDDKGILQEFALPDKLPTAFVCNNDHAAYLLIRQLKQRGISVPGDVSVVGFDDVLYAEISDPPITSVHVKRKFMAEQAIGLLKRRMESPDAGARVVTIDCSIVYRESVAGIGKALTAK